MPRLTSSSAWSPGLARPLRGRFRPPAGSQSLPTVHRGDSFMPHRVLLVSTALAFAAPAARAQVVFSDNFDADHTANWNTNISTNNSTGSAANYFFDYGTVGIPSAPNSTGGTTRGLKLEANFVVGAGVV